MANDNKDKKKRNRYTSPKGMALFAHVVDVFYGTEKYPNPKGEYSITLSLDASDADKMEALLADDRAEANAFAEAAFAEMKPASQKRLGEVKMAEFGPEEYDKDGNPTGNRLFRFKTAAFYEKNGKKIMRKIALFDSMQQPVKLKDEPGNGSVVRAAFTAVPYFVEGTGVGGLTLYLDALQIVKLNKFGERSATDYGFGAEEDGFSAADVVDENDFSNTYAPDDDATTASSNEPSDQGADF